MLGFLKNKFETFDSDWRRTFIDGLDDAKIRKSAVKHAYWMDHEVLRQFYHNDHEIHKNVFRSNQPSPERIKRWHRRGVKTILNLRGKTNQGAYYLEKEACRRYGIHLIDFRLFATKLPPGKSLLKLKEIFEDIEKPFLMHCKSGSDRAGLGSALYFLFILNAPIELAQKQLSLKYLHLGGWTAGILDFMLMEFRLTSQMTGVSFKDWLRIDYDAAELTKGFKNFRENNHIFKVPR